MNNSQARVEEVLAEAARLFAVKNVTYQDSWRTQGWRGNLSRILEKAGRLRAMLWRGGNVLLNGSKEHPRETLLDVINTSAFLIINMDDNVEWGHEPQAKEIQPPYDVDKLRREYAFSMGSTPSDFYADQWPEHLRKPTDQQRPEWLHETADEQTVVTPAVGDVPTPAEERPTPKPRKRVTVTDRGSQPRPVRDDPQV